MRLRNSCAFVIILHVCLTQIWKISFFSLVVLIGLMVMAPVPLHNHKDISAHISLEVTKVQICLHSGLAWMLFPHDRLRAAHETQPDMLP